VSAIRLSDLGSQALAAVDRALGDNRITWIITDEGAVPVAAVVPLDVGRLARELHDDAQWARGIAAADDATIELPAVRAP
jgi:hypothetical protein